MQAHEIKAFIDAMAASDLAELEASKDGWTLRLVRGAARAGANGRPSTAAAPEANGGSSVDARAPALAASAWPDICSSMCGVVFLQPAPGEAPFVQPGQAVKAGDTVCVIEAMKVFNAVHAEHDGIVEALLVTSGQEVDAGQPLVRLR